MLLQALQATLNLLLFRIGPQDFPYAPGLTRVLLVAALAVHYAVFSRVLPPLMAVAMAAALIGGMALTTRSLLAMRGLEARFQQTYNALLATGTVLMALFAIPFSQVAPQLLAIATSPDPIGVNATAALPRTASLLMNLVNFWSFAVSANIYRHAANFNLAIGVLAALAVSMLLLMLVAFGGSLVAALFGVDPTMAPTAR